MSKTTQYWPVICSYFEYMRFELGLVKTTYPHNSRFDNAAIQPKNARQINWTTSCAKKSSPGQPHFFFSINSIESFYLKVKRSCLLRLEFTSKNFPQTVKRFWDTKIFSKGQKNFLNSMKYLILSGRTCWT